MNKFYKYLIPSVVSTVLMSTYAIIDGMFIGQKLSDIGLSAINLAWPITALLQSLGIGIGLSGGILISTLEGKKDIIEIPSIKKTTIILILFISIILGGLLLIFSENILVLFQAEGLTLEYAKRYINVILLGSSFQMLGCGLIPLLKNSGKIKSAFLASLTSIIVNLVLDYIFIILLNWEIEGAALASVLAQLGSFLVCIFAYYKEINNCKVSFKYIKKLFSCSLAPFIINYSYSIIIIITNALCMIYGNDEAVAAYTLLSYLLYIISASGSSVADSIQPLFSYNNGNGLYKENYKMLKKCLLISLLICLIESIIFFVLNESLQDLYNLSETARIYYSTGILYYLFGFLLVSLFRVIVSYLYSINDEKYANILTLSEPFLVTPIIYLLVCPFLKLAGVWLSYLIIQIILLTIGFILLSRRIKKERVS